MKRPQKLEDRAGLAPLLERGWAEVPGRDAIQKTFEFKTFVQAFGWMTQVAMLSERIAHHPEWTNVFNKVTVTLTTHDADGVTELDLRLAKRMEALASGAVKSGKRRKARGETADSADA